MKKSMLALAALTLVTGVAYAQSSVTMYGTIDASLQYINKAGNTASTINKDLTLGYVDSAVSSSVWGLRGSEDLGGGLKSSFQIEGDIQTNNGGLHKDGLFRRAANVGIGGAFGQIDLGLKANPLMATNNALMPVAGNSVAGAAAYAGGYKDDYTKNAITYTTPHIYGIRGQAQVGFGNTVGAGNGGSVYAGSLAYDGIKNLTVRAAYQRRIGKDSSASSANSGSVTNYFISSGGTDKTSYLAGLSYKWDGLTLAYGWMHNNTATKNLNISQFGVGYQATPAVLLGASYAISTMGGSLINAQVRYGLSKRSTIYGQVGFTSNSSSAKKENGAFAPVATTSGDIPAADLSGYDFKGTSNVSSTAVGVGIIHTF